MYWRRPDFSETIINFIQSNLLEINLEFIIYVTSQVDNEKSNKSCL